VCRSEADGGQRCAAHTRPAYAAATAAFESAPDDPRAQDDLTAAAAAYASTPTGRERVHADASRPGTGAQHAACLRTAIARGEAIRAAHQAARPRRPGVRDTARYGFAGHDYALGSRDFPQERQPGPVERAMLPASALTATQEHLTSKPDLAKARGMLGRTGGPVDVIEHPDGRLCIRDGHHRACAYAASGLPIPCVIHRLPPTTG
jgi:hypothetical protein